MPDDATMPVPPMMPVPSPVLMIVMDWGFSIAGFAYFAFVTWMVIDCIRREPDAQYWIWLILVLPGVGPLAYFFLRYAPNSTGWQSAVIKRLSRGRQLQQLEAAAKQIGNPHQFVLYGDALRECGYWDRAGHAYAQALAKAPADLPASWGAALVAEHAGRFTEVRKMAEAVLAKDPQYRFGDVQLTLIRSLLALNERDAARKQLVEHVRRWRHPETIVRLAELEMADGRSAEAKSLLEGLMVDLNGSPSAYAYKFGRWRSRAKRMLRSL